MGIYNVCLYDLPYKLFLNKTSTTFNVSVSKHVEMNKTSCSLSSTWMIVIVYLFYTKDISSEYIDKLVVEWL